jgi:hypothetical protein
VLKLLEFGGEVLGFDSVVMVYVLDEEGHVVEVLG